jgi:hypothetical protein
MAELLYEGLSDYGVNLKLNLIESYTGTNNPIGLDCNITFNNLGKIEFDFFKTLTPTPLQFKLFDKFDEASDILTDLNSLFILMIEDLQCCDLAEKYNDAILPLFLWFIGDAGDKDNHPRQFGEWRKKDGFLPILIKITEMLMKAYEPVKALMCLIRPVPGNPWAKTGGYDWLKPVYNIVEDFDFIMSTILDGDYLDILIEPMADFRDQIMQCYAHNRGDLSIIDNDSTNLAIMRSNIEYLLSNYASSINLNSKTAPTYSKAYFEAVAELEIIIKNESNSKVSLTNIFTNLNNAKAQKYIYENRIEDIKIELNTTDIDLIHELANQLNTTDIKSYEYYYYKLAQEFLQKTSELEILEANIKKWEDEQKTITGDITNNNGSLRKKYEAIRDKEAKIYQEQLILYNLFQAESNIRIQQYKDCALTSQILMEENIEKTTYCSCLGSLAEIFLPLPELINFASKTDIEENLYDRLPYTGTELDNYRTKKYELISKYNYIDKIGSNYFTLYPGAGFRTKYVGIEPTKDLGDIEYPTAATIYKLIDDAKDVTDVISVSNIIIGKRNNLAKFKLTLDTKIQNELRSITNALQVKKLELLKKITDYSSIIRTRYKNTFTASNDVAQEYNEVVALKAKIYDIQNDIRFMDDLINNSTAYNFVTPDSKTFLLKYGINVSSKLELYIDQSDTLQLQIKDWEYLLKMNTRVVTVLSTENIKCDCNIICSLIQWLVNLIMDAINTMILKIIDAILNAVVPKEIAYVIKFIRAKLQCAVDIMEIKNNWEKISKRATSLIEQQQMKMEYAQDPSFCNPIKTGISTDFNNTIIESLVNYNNSDLDNTGYGEGSIVDIGGVEVVGGSDDDPRNNYPNTSGSVDQTDNLTINKNELIIKNVVPGKQYEFRNIPTLYFDCAIEDPNLRPVFDIYTDIIPNTWTLYFSFELTPEKLLSLSNYSITTDLNNTEQTITKLVYDNFAKTLPIAEVKDLINYQDYYNQAKTLAAEFPERIKTKTEECTPDPIFSQTSGITSCGYESLEFVSVELLNTKVNNSIVDFQVDAGGISIQKKTSAENPSYHNIPIKVKVKKIFDSTASINVVDYFDEQTSVILLLDFINGKNDLSSIKLSDYSSRPQFDANLFYGRYPYLDIGFRATYGNYYLKKQFSDLHEIDETNFNTIFTEYLYLDNDLLLHYADLAIQMKNQRDQKNYAPTEEQIAARKKELEDLNDLATCDLPDETKQAVEVSKTIKDDMLALVQSLQYKSNAVVEWSQNNSTEIPINEYENLLNLKTKTTEYGIPLIELNEDDNICLQIIQTRVTIDGESVLKPMLNVSNFNFLANILQINDDNNIPMVIEPNTTYFVTISFDGTKYIFTVIDENKVTASLTKLKTKELFPTRFGRLSDPELSEQTFCGTLFDLGVSNEVLDPAVYYKFSMLNFKPKSSLFIDFEHNVNNNFYSTSDLPVVLAEDTNIADEIKSYIEQTYLKGNVNTTVPFFIYNKYVSTHSMTPNLIVDGNNYKNALKEALITNFFCKESIKNQSFTMSFWFKPIKSNVEVMNERMVLISDTKFDNTFYYNRAETSLIFSQNINGLYYTKNIYFPLEINTWYNMVLKFDHLTNQLIWYCTSEHDSELHIILNETLTNQFNFNLISLLSEFNFDKKEFTNYFPCLFGNLIIDMNLYKSEKLLDFFRIQRLAFKGF